VNGGEALASDLCKLDICSRDNLACELDQKKIEAFATAGSSGSTGLTTATGRKPAAKPLSGTPAIGVDFSESCHWDVPKVARGNWQRACRRPASIPKINLTPGRRAVDCVAPGVTKGHDPALRIG
jgi:hypothetical protein